jgi:hypothetical protein
MLCRVVCWTKEVLSALIEHPGGYVAPYCNTFQISSPFGSEFYILGQCLQVCEENLFFTDLINLRGGSFWRASLLNQLTKRGIECGLLLCSLIFPSSREQSYLHTPSTVRPSVYCIYFKITEFMVTHITGTFKNAIKRRFVDVSQETLSLPRHTAQGVRC